MVRTAIAGVTISIGLVAVPASAQSALSARPGHGFATVGVIGSPLNDPADGVNQVQLVNRGNLLVSGAVFVAPRVGVGIETFPAHDTTAEVANYASFAESERLHEKTALMVTARGRAVAQSRFAIDGVFGIGALRQVRASTIEYRYPPFTPTITTRDNTSAAFSLGADAPISVVRHVAVIPQMRWYHVRRLGTQVFAAVTPTSAPLDSPASLFAFGVTVGITW